MKPINATSIPPDHIPDAKEMVAAMNELLLLTQI